MVCLFWVLVGGGGSILGGDGFILCCVGWLWIFLGVGGIILSSCGYCWVYFG